MTNFPLPLGANAQLNYLHGFLCRLTNKMLQARICSGTIVVFVYSWSACRSDIGAKTSNTTDLHGSRQLRAPSTVPAAQGQQLQLHREMAGCLMPRLRQVPKMQNSQGMLGFAVVTSHTLALQLLNFASANSCCDAVDDLSDLLLTCGLCCEMLSCQLPHAAPFGP